MTWEKGADRIARLTRFSLDRRITILVMMVTIVVVGVIAALGIPLELVPRGIEEPFLGVFVPWQDAPAREVLAEIPRAPQHLLLGDLAPAGERHESWVGHARLLLVVPGSSRSRPGGSAQRKRAAAPPVRPRRGGAC